MPKKSAKRQLKRCLIISPIADKSTEERKAIHKRALFLEKEIAAALRPVGYAAQLITSDKEKQWITPQMIRRLTSDPLAVAVLDGANPNCMYEVGIRHAVCLPMICLIEQRTSGPSLPFNVKDVDPVQYPRLGKALTWTKNSRASFRAMLQKRARMVIDDRPSNDFQNALDRVSESTSARRMLRMIFSQKQQELGFLRKDLDDYLHFVLKDYEINVSINDDAAKRLFALLDSNNIRLMHRNDVLHALVGRTEMACLEGILAPFNAICDRVMACAGQLATLALTIKKAIGENGKPPPGKPPTRGKVEGEIQSIIHALDALDGDLVALLKLHVF